MVSLTVLKWPSFDGGRRGTKLLPGSMPPINAWLANAMWWPTMAEPKNTLPARTYDAHVHQAGATVVEDALGDGLAGGELRGPPGGHGRAVDGRRSPIRGGETLRVAPDRQDDLHRAAWSRCQCRTGGSPSSPHRRWPRSWTARAGTPSPARSGTAPAKRGSRRLPWNRCCRWAAPVLAEAAVAPSVTARAAAGRAATANMRLIIVDPSIQL